MVEHLNTLARLWWDWSTAMLWQAGLLIVVIGCIDLLIRRWAWPQLRYALWSLILIKLLLPPTLSLPSGIIPELQPAVSQAFRLMNPEEPVAEERPIADFGFRIADLNRGVDPQFARLGISNPRFEISDLPSDATPHPALRIPHLTWQVYAMLAWLAGTLTLGIWLFLRLHSLCSRHAYQAAAASLPQSFYNRMADCANRLGLRHVPRVVVTKRLASPAVFGAFRPVLLMPKGYLSKLSRRDTEHMLLHELAHVKRGDLTMHSLYMLLQISYWYNPLLWLVRRQMHHLRELSCDATVANLLRERTTAYRQTLLETARRLLTTSVEPGLGLLGLFEDSNRLLVRLNWLTKPTWRYRTMKRTIVIAIAALMIACVLPMAQAQESESSDAKRIVRDEIIRVNVEERDRPSRDPLSQELNALQKHLDHMMDQQKELQNQLRILAEKRRAMSPEQEDRREQGDELSRHLDTLQRQLDEMTNQQRDLQKQLRALADERRRLAEPRREGSREIIEGRGGGAPRRERVEVNEEIDVMVSPRELPDRPRLEREARESADRVKRERAMAETERALADAKRAAAEAQREQVQRQYGERMKAWGAEMKQWEQGEPMQQWRRQMERWQEQMQEWAQSLSHQHTDADGVSPEAVEPPPAPPMPPMPAMPKVPAPGKKEFKLQFKTKDPKYGDAEQTYDETEENLGDIYDEEIVAINVPPIKIPRIEVPEIKIPPIEIPRIEVPVPPMPPEVPDNAGDLEEAVHHVGFSSIPGDRFLEVENHVGSITVRSGDAFEYVIRATVKGRAETQERAREIAEQLTITDTGPQADDVERIIVSKPQGLKNRENCVVIMEVITPREARLRLRQEVGDIRLTGLRGTIEASDRVGSIRAVDVAGRVALNTDVGGIEFVAPKGLSANVQAKTNLGGIQSDLPLEFAKSDSLAMGHKASGTVGDGEGNISLKTNMGSIHIRSRVVEPGRTERSRPEPRPDPRPQPRPDPQPEEVF